MCKTVIALVTLLAFAAGAAWGQAGRISGVVTAEGGATPPNTPVTIQAWPDGGAFRFHQSTALTRPGGGFAFNGVPPGRYAVCALPAGDLLHSCLWTRQPQTVQVNPGQAATANIRLVRGHRFRLRFADPGNLLAARDASGTNLVAGVAPAAVGMLPMMRGAGRANEREYELLVPFDVPLQLFVRSPVFRVKNEQGAVVDARGGHRAPVTVSRASPPQALVYQIDGVQ